MKYEKAALLCGDAAFFHTFLFFMNVAVNSFTYAYPVSMMQ